VISIVVQTGSKAWCTVHMLYDATDKVMIDYKGVVSITDIGSASSKAY
jgi:hypothetical protein